MEQIFLNHHEKIFNLLHILKDQYGYECSIVYKSGLISGEIIIKSKHFTFIISAGEYSIIDCYCCFDNIEERIPEYYIDRFLGIPKFHNSTSYFNTFSNDVNQYILLSIKYKIEKIIKFYTPFFEGFYSFENYKNWENKISYYQENIGNHLNYKIYLPYTTIVDSSDNIIREEFIKEKLKISHKYYGLSLAGINIADTKIRYNQLDELNHDKVGELINELILVHNKNKIWEKKQFLHNVIISFTFPMNKEKIDSIKDYVCGPKNEKIVNSIDSLIFSFSCGNGIEFFKRDEIIKYSLIEESITKDILAYWE